MILTAGTIASISFDITVCGNEMITIPTASYFLVYYKTPSQTSVTSVSTYQAWFTMTYGATSHTSCIINQYALFSDSICLLSWTDPKVVLDTTAVPSGGFYPLSVDIDTQFTMKTLYMQAKTRG